MAIPAQAAENDIFNPGVLELDGSRTFTISNVGCATSACNSAKSFSICLTSGIR